MRMCTGDLMFPPFSNTVTSAYGFNRMSSRALDEFEDLIRDKVEANKYFPSIKLSWT